MNLGDYKQRLLKLEQDLATRLRSEVDTARDTRDDQAEPGDLAHVEEMKGEYFALAQSDSAILAQVRAALARIDDGTYGYCEETGEPISLRRLEARPIATLSVEAQERHERRERVYRDD